MGGHTYISTSSCLCISPPLSIEVQIIPVQTNNIDCGLWVLVHIAAVLRGCEITGLSKSDMNMFQQYLRLLVLRIPAVST